MIRLKVAVAMAIIRQKPPHMTGQQYAERLSVIFLSCRDKQKDHFYQENDLETIAPQELLTSDSKECESNSKDFEVAHSAHQKPGHKEIPTPIMTDHQPELFEVENTRFMQSVICLNTIDFSNGQRKDKLKSCIGQVTNFCDILLRDITTLSKSCLLHSAAAIISLLEREEWLNESEDFMKSVCDLIDTILLKVTTAPNGNIEWNSLHRKKSSMVDMLLVFMKSKSTPLTSTILETMLEAWENVCDGLRLSRHFRQPLNPVDFANSFFIIKCLELIAKQWLHTCHLDMFFLQETQERLDRSLLHLTDPFPLVSQAVWKVTSFIERVFQEKIV